MGDPKKQRKKYSTPDHPWKAERIKEEREITKEYGLKSKKEIWKMNSLLKKIKEQAKKSITGTEQEKKEEQQLKDKLNKLGLINKKDIKKEDILALGLKDIMDRRLQTIVYKKSLARTVKQARQFIIHGHIMVDNKKITTPSYIVLKNEEDKITFSPASKLNNEQHPERIKKETVKEKKEVKRKVVKPLKKKTDKAEKVKQKKTVKKQENKEQKEKPKEND